MTKSIIATVSVITILTACARENESRPDDAPKVFTPVNTGREFKAENFPNVANSVYGAWDADFAEKFGEGMAYFLSIYMNDNDEIGIKRTCIGFGEKIEVATVVNGKVEGGKIKIGESAYVLEKSGGANCDLTVKAESLSYTRTGNSLEVTFKPGETRSFTRAKAAGGGL